MNRFRSIPALVLFAAVIAVVGCSRKPADLPTPSSESPTAAAQDDHGAERGEEDAAALALNAAERASAGLRVEALAPMRLAEILQAPGEVVHNAYSVTLITPRVAALVVRRHARLGDEVATGAPLVTLSSVEAAEAQGELLIAEQEWQRIQQLGRDAVSGRRYTEATVAMEQARAKARAYGLPPASASTTANGEFTLSAPHAGRLTEEDFVIGQRIEPGHALFRLVDESTVWVDAKLPAEVARRVVVGTDATVVAGRTSLRGRVTQSAHRTAEDTRNAHVRIEVPNDGDRLHAGDFVEVSLEAHGEGVEQLAVPTDAVVQLQGQTVVFREHGDVFESVPVKTGAVVGDRTVIAAGLAAGDRIVVAGTYALKARLLKAQLGEGHGH